VISQLSQLIENPFRAQQEDVDEEVDEDKTRKVNTGQGKEKGKGQRSSERRTMST
jgi:hypothetical protein